MYKQASISKISKSIICVFLSLALVLSYALFSGGGIAQAFAEDKIVGWQFLDFSAPSGFDEDTTDPY
ncbi:MAG: hypothetical protein MJ189_03745 [Coriobacteriales bacterium]|nr:hypothetical protein [Coriobacteriales bacterium]